MVVENTGENHTEHAHVLIHQAVLPTPERLDAHSEHSGKGITIAFLDSGFYPHPDLTEPVNRIVAFRDVTQSRSSLNARRPPKGWMWHGTQTSVVAAGNGFLSDGVYRGLASDARVVLVKVGAGGKITEKNIARGLRWVIENKDRYNIRVISISLGGDDDIPYQENVVDQVAEEAVSKGLTVVVAAGNSGCTDRPNTVPPANSPSVITVGGYDDKNELDRNDLALYCSSFGFTADGIVKPEILGPAMWVAAPILPGTPLYQKAIVLSQLAAAPDFALGRIARELWPGAESLRLLADDRPAAIRKAVESLTAESKIVASHYQHVDGTSFAAPIVASVVAQMLEANPDLTPALVKQILITTADRIQGAPLLRQGYGVLNARRAVEEAGREKHAFPVSGLGPPRMEGDKLVFQYHNDSARSVSLVGDFNQWNPSHTRFRRTGEGGWRAEIDPPQPGSYGYKFLINGERWLEDPANGLKAPDNYGGLNSVLNVSVSQPLVRRDGDKATPRPRRPHRRPTVLGENQQGDAGTQR